MKAVAQAIDKESQGTYVLTSGTGLLFGYDLPRHSVDLDYDTLAKKDLAAVLKNAAEEISGEKAFVRLQKDAETFQRYFIRLAKEENPEILKVEILLERPELDIEKETFKKDGMTIYKLPILAEQKLGTLLPWPDGRPGRMRVRDVFDAEFLFSKHPEAIKPEMGLKIKEDLDRLGMGGLKKRLDDEIASNPKAMHLLRGKDPQAIILSLYAQLEKFAYNVEKGQVLNEKKEINQIVRTDEG